MPMILNWLAPIFQPDRVGTSCSPPALRSSVIWPHCSRWKPCQEKSVSSSCCVVLVSCRLEANFQALHLIFVVRRKRWLKCLQVIRSPSIRLEPTLRKQVTLLSKDHWFLSPNIGGSTRKDKVSS